MILNSLIYKLDNTVYTETAIISLLSLADDHKPASLPYIYTHEHIAGGQMLITPEGKKKSMIKQFSK